uniref:Fibronectin type-III domain-containing protein n=1 Tax=Sparus aurata TaxID=8175 RepID=A0A671UN45_SPAAU
MDSDASRTMEVAALGRPFGLGMLYDCRTDSLIPGLTLWDHSDLAEHIVVRPQNHNDFKMVASESIEDKSSALNVEASLKASFLGGLVEVAGSAKYLNDSKTSKNQARVTLKYEATTKVKELSMDHLGRGNVKHPYIFDKGLATHVVTAVLYGAQAFFVFDHEVSEKEDHQDIEGNLKVMIEKIPCLAIEGEGSLKMEDNDREKVEKFSCRFFGDFSLQKTPTSFDDAIQVYQSLPTLLGANGENAVPMKVWMLPLTCLDSSAAKLIRQISLTLVKKSQSVLEYFSELEMRCNDALKTTTAQQFPQIGTKIKTFKEKCSEFKLEFQQTLAKKLPSIRGGGEEEAVLAEILKKIHSSPFNSKDLNKWMDCKERAVHTLQSFTNMMKNTKIVSSETDLYKESLSADHTVCFVFTSLGSYEPYLSTLSEYLEETTKPDEARGSRTHDVEKEQWYASREVADKMRSKAKLFSDFAEANKENKNIKFLAVGSTDDTQKGSSIYLYKDSFSVTENFEPPSKPEILTVRDINHNSVTLKISPAKFGAENITSYSVEYCVSGQDGWKEKTAAEAEEVTVSDLSPNTEYKFRCRAVTSVGVGPANEVSGSIKTLSCSSPGKPQVEPNSRDITVSWDKPAELGLDVQILSYIVEYAKTDSRLKEEDLQWNQKMSETEKTIISGLQPETEYVVRVRCDCGEAGRNKESISVGVCTRKYSPLAESLRSASTCINSKSPSVYKLHLTEENTDVGGCQRYRFGNDIMRKNRTIIIFGEAESGQSRLINGMINYIVGVEWEDNFRFVLVDEDQRRSQAYSQTSDVTVYKINHQQGFKIDHSLTVVTVDTPGFGDKRGIKRDKEITEQLFNLFSSNNGVSEIDAVCFVAQVSVARLTPAQIDVFDSVLSIFGKDVAENIRVLVTFADGQRPPVLEAIKASGVPCPKSGDGLPLHFKFNNSALFADNKPSGAGSMTEEDEDGGLGQMCWNMGTRSMKKFFDALNVIETKSLTLTKEVLRERQQLENSVENLHKWVTLGLAKLEEMEQTNEKLKEQEAVMNRTENVLITRTVIEANCTSESHYRCPEYRKAKKDKAHSQEFLVKLKSEYDYVQADVVKLMESSAKCLNRLKEISLKPNPLSTPEYIDLLIEEEKSVIEPGWKKRLKHLLAIRE